MEENNDLNQQYQSILEKYSQELKATQQPTPDTTEVTPTIIPQPTYTPQPSITRTPTPLPQPPVVPTSSVKKSSNIFKLFFYLSLIIFLGIVSMIIYTINNNSTVKPTPITDDISPTITPIKYCETNDNKIASGESFPATDGCNTCTCGTDLTITCTEKVCEPTPTLLPTPTNKKNLLPANAESPASGICSDAPLGSIVTIILGVDNIPQPRCSKVTSSQKLVLINNSEQSVIITQITPKITVKSGNSYQFTKTFGELLAPGVHSIGGAEIWMQ